jgi:hypothetical protein
MMATDLNKALSLVPEIKAAHEEAEKSQRASHSRALEYAIKAGDALTLAKEAVGHGAFGIWRQQNLPQLPQTTASLYMRLAEHKDKFRPGGQISNTVATLTAKGELSLRKAAALLPKRQLTAAQIAAAKRREEAKAAEKKGDEGIAKEWLKPLDVDELVIFLRQVFDAGYMGRLRTALTPPTT